ncbi:serine hydrolase domain-containing protein [Okibacterium fritillariae]|uniref:CubicO group peptidase, beta-lactamase class C family n=1 Tax=Okibacterium fritillariae TaxID=123320 RepID=A0A1T5IJ78_9MICO|nr:serine hydrolase domain-containing protein [Okibacterium fritillariae]SKC39205.1 CubicO group peptidase, beta-lactamase class C family [Okibacterium fritillariae]
MTSHTAPTPHLLDSVDALFSARALQRTAPSGVWGVFGPDGLVHAGGHGSVAGTVPDAHTAYRIASCTKSFTAAALLALRDEGALALDEPITRFLPGFAAVPLPSADAPVPTVRMLMTMSAGLPTDDPWGDRQESITNDQLDALIADGLSFDSIPGTTFAYSNLGYALLGRVIEEASGRAYRDVVRERFLEPLGLTGTGFDASIGESDGVSGVAIGNRFLDGAWQELPFTGPGAFSPIGGLFSTVADLSRWAAWLAEPMLPDGVSDGAEPEPRSTPLSRASRREMQQLQRYAPGFSALPAGYGFGLVVEQHPRFGTVVSHSGGYPGFSAHMRWVPSRGLGVVAFENATYSRVSAAATAALDLLADATSEVLSLDDRVWPETRVAQRAVSALIHDWSDAAAARLFAENVPLDEPFENRRAAIARAIAAVDGLLPLTPEVEQATAGLARETSSTPSHLVWRLPGNRGALRVEIRLTPQKPPLVQTFSVRAEHR